MRFLRACAALGMLAALGGGAEAQSKLEITSPESGTVVNPGHVIGVSVLATGAPLEFVSIIGQDPIGFSAARKEPPYQFDIQIPEKITPGRYTLGAVGKPVSGEAVISEAIIIDVERADQPVKITAGSRKLDMEIGWELPLGVEGTYADGSIVSLTNSTQTTYLSEAPQVASVTPYGVVKAIAPGSTRIIIDGKIAVPVTVEPLINIFPATATLKASQTRAFTAWVTRPPNGKVTWTLNPGIGSVADGKYTAPDALTSAQTVQITATSVDDPSVTATAVITLSPQDSIEVIPGYAVLYKGQTQHFTATTANAGTEGVKWSVSPGGAGSIDANGLYTAPDPIKKMQPVKVVATSAANPAISGSTTIYISPRPFKLFSYPLSVSLSPGKTVGATVLPLATDGFFHPLALSVDGAPIGIRTTLSADTLKGNTPATLTFSYENDTVPGDYQVTVTARDTVYPALTDAETFTLHVGR